MLLFLQRIENIDISNILLSFFFFTKVLKIFANTDIILLISLIWRYKNEEKSRFLCK